MHCDRGNVTVGAGPLPKELEPADALTLGIYTPVVPMGRTVNAAMTEEEQQQRAEYGKSAFRFDKEAGRRPVDQSWAFYLRVMQANDAMAWSSPTWVGGSPPL